MASLAGAVNDQWDSPMLGSSWLKGIWKSICSRIWNLLSKVAASSVCIEAKGKREGERALWSVHWPGHCTPVSASDSTRLHRGGRVFERMRNNTPLLPAAAAFPQALFLYCCGQTNQATNMTWHSLKNSSNNHLFICFALLISSGLVYILDSGLRRVGRNFGEEELQILTYIWKFDSLVWMYPLVARKTFNIPWQHERARLPQCSQATVASSATTFTCHESSTTTGQECND